jgi:hypothetical protein
MEYEKIRCEVLTTVLLIIQVFRHAVSVGKHEGCSYMIGTHVEYNKP